MKLLLISGAYPPMAAGEATNTHFLAQNLATRGVDVHVLTSQKALDPKAAGVTLHPLMREWSWPEIFRVDRLVRELAPDAILLMYIGFIYNHHPMITFAPTVSKRALPSATFVTRIENPFNPSVELSILDRGLRKAVAQLLPSQDVNYTYGTLLSRSDKVIVLSQRHHAAFLNESPGILAKLRIIPPPPNIRLAPAASGNHYQAVRRSLGLSPDSILLVYLGYIYPIRGIDTLLRAFEILCRRHGNVHLVLIGGDIDPAAGLGYSYLAQMQELARSLGIHSRVTWAGSFSYDDEWPSEYLRAADICVLPNANGLQLNNSSFASAAVHALPIVSTRGAIPDPELQHGDNVFLCPPSDPVSLGDAIEHLIDDLDLRRRISNGVRKLAARCFSWDKAIAQTIETLAPSRPQAS